MSGTKPPKPTVKELEKVIEALTDQLDLERKSIRLPSVMTVGQFNTMVEFLNSVKPVPVAVKDVPPKKIIEMPTDIIPQDQHSTSQVN